MIDARKIRAKRNIITSFAFQIISLICGFLLPQLFIRTYGSEAYGIGTSITQFLAYISLLEGGIGGVARAALYKPLSENNIEKIQAILNEIKCFFRVVGFVFIGYVIILASIFHGLARVECFDWITTFWLVIAISLSLFGQYFIGLSYAVLLNAAQRQFFGDIVNIISIIVNTVLVVFFIKLGCNFLTVKFVTGVVFLCRPIFLKFYADRIFKFKKNSIRERNALKDKWVGLGQHIAYFIHTNTDIIVLTLFGNLKMVAVYSVYYMVTNSIQSLASAFSSGMEAVFGDMLARNEMNKLKNTFLFYDTLISMISTVLFSVTAVMINSFIKIYTNGVNDVDYSAPFFSLLLTIAALIFCLRIPYNLIIIAAGKFRETQWAAYGEAIINVGLTIFLVYKLNIIGAALATVIAVLFRFLYYIFYLKKEIIGISMEWTIRREVVNMVTFISCYLIESHIINALSISAYFDWALYSALNVIISAIIVVVCNFCFFKGQVVEAFKFLRRIK